MIFRELVLLIEHFSTFINQLTFDLQDINLNPEKLVLIMDNVKFHKTAAIKDLILQRGFHLEYLLQYSPFLNPIENIFTKLKEFTKRHFCNNETEIIAAISVSHFSPFSISREKNSHIEILEKIKVNVLCMIYIHIYIVYTISIY